MITGASALPGQDAAFAWLEAGVCAFPCDPSSKKPLIHGWRQQSDVALLREQSRIYPHAMAGLDCGNAGGVVVDCDKAEDLDGVQHFRALCERLGVDLQGIPRVLTPRGGTHFYFGALTHTTIKNSAGALGPGIDIRGDGGLVILPGSVRTDGKRYELLHPGTLEQFAHLLANRGLPGLPAALSGRSEPPHG